MLVEQAQRDSLTCLYNSATIRSMAAEAMDGGDGRGALLIIDIDHFKSVNDQYGHFTGDRVLSGLSGVLGGVFRHEDLLGRLGGDEFAVFMTSVKERTVVEDKCRLILKAGSGAGDRRGRAAGEREHRRGPGRRRRVLRSALPARGPGALRG